MFLWGQPKIAQYLDNIVLMGILQGEKKRKEKKRKEKKRKEKKKKKKKGKIKENAKRGNEKSGIYSRWRYISQESNLSCW